MKKIVNAEQMKRMLERFTFQLIEACPEVERLALVGIHRRGVPISNRLRSLLEKHKGVKPDTGLLDITLYRDDLSEISAFPQVYSTKVDFPIDQKHIVLVDDVIYTGRTCKAALDALSDIGRAAKIYMLALIDRGHREFPIHADFVGKIVPTSATEIIKVHTKEIDGEDAVYIAERE